MIPVRPSSVNARTVLCRTIFIVRKVPRYWLETCTSAIRGTIVEDGRVPETGSVWRVRATERAAYTVKVTGVMITEDERATTRAEPSARRLRAAGAGLWMPRLALAALIAFYVCLWGASGLLTINPTDFDVFFLPSAHIALAGHPFDIYAVRYQVVYPNANGPLAILPLTLVAALAQWLGWLGNVYLRRMLVLAAFSVFPLLLGREALLAVDRLRGKRLEGTARLLAYAAIVLSPELWHSVLLYGHIEQPLMLWLVLASVRALVEERSWRAGLLLGLALLDRSMSVLYLLPLALLLVARGRWRIAVAMTGIAGGVALLGLLPFWLADRRDLVYSLSSFRTALPVGGGSFWGMFLGTPLEAVGQRWDSAVVLGSALAVTLATLVLRRDLDVASRDVYALLALTGLCFPLFMKTLWPYYFLDIYTLLAVWWLTGLRRGPALVPSRRTVLWWLGIALPLAVVVVAQIGERGVTVMQDPVWLQPWSLLDFAATLLIAVAVAARLWWRARAGKLKSAWWS